MNTYKVTEGHNYYTIEADGVGLEGGYLRFFKRIPGVDDKMELIALFDDWDNFVKVDDE